MIKLVIKHTEIAALEDIKKGIQFVGKSGVLSSKQFKDFGEVELSDVRAHFLKHF